MSSQPHLPGSNNASTVGRAIDTYDRGFDGADGTREPVETSLEERRLAAQGLLTGTGYYQDGFVVEDANPPALDDQPPAQPTEPAPRQRTQVLVLETDDEEEEENDSDYDPAEDEDNNSDYDDNSDYDEEDYNSDYDGSQPDSLS